MNINDVLKEIILDFQARPFEISVPRRLRIERGVVRTIVVARSGHANAGTVALVGIIPLFIRRIPGLQRHPGSAGNEPEPFARAKGI